MDDTKRFYALAMDPIHIGTGGYRLGRVDNTIVREPGTNLPKIPASSISGVCRNYAIYGLDDEEKEAAVACTKREKDKNNCGKCRICQTFGFAAGQQKASQVGKVKFFDAEITAFPVSTMFGPVWVTTASILKGLGVSGEYEPGSETLLSTFDVKGGKLNLGWLYLDCKKIEDEINFPEAGTSDPVKAVQDKLVIAPDYLFSEIVNSNLEVRTSVSIDFETGAAEKHALFTYEAIPRTTLFTFDVVVDSYRCTETVTPDKVWQVVNSGLTLFEVMGIGGMNTRGFGRIRIANL